MCLPLDIMGPNNLAYKNHLLKVIVFARKFG